jgi:hypothetical protein
LASPLRARVGWRAGSRTGRDGKWGFPFELYGGERERVCVDQSGGMALSWRVFIRVHVCVCVWLGFEWMGCFGRSGCGCGMLQWWLTGWGNAVIKVFLLASIVGG